MARCTFGGSSSDFVYNTTPLAGVQVLQPRTTSLTMWTAASGGSQVTDLLVGGVAATSVITDLAGRLALFQGPDGVTVLWADPGDGSLRTRLVSPDLATQAAAQAQASAAAAAASAASGVSVTDNGLGGISSSQTSITDNNLGGISA